MSIALSAGAYAQGSITASVSSIRYEFNLPGDDNYVIFVEGVDSGGGTLADPAVNFLMNLGLGGYVTTASDNDSGNGKDALIVTWAYAGWHAIDVQSNVAGQTGTYTLWYAPQKYVEMGATPGDNPNISGTAANDVIDGLAGADTMLGLGGDDTYYVDQGGDLVIEVAGAGNDTIYSTLTRSLALNVENLLLSGGDDINGTGNNAANILQGNAGNNALYGLDGADTLYGGGGNDTLYGGNGNDSMSGGNGDDIFYVNSLNDIVAADPSGLDTVISTVSFTLASGCERLTLTGAAHLNGVGNELNNTLTGNGGNNYLTGGDGNDSLTGGLGADTLDGGAGNDVYSIDNVGDIVIDAGGVDTLNSSVSRTLAAGFENINLTGSAAINATGNAAANTFWGNQNSAANVLTGLGGNDVYTLGAGDSVVESAGGGIDLIHAGFTYTLGAYQEKLTLTGSGNFNGTGNLLNNALTGNAGNNQLTAGDGNDTLNGGLGADTLSGGAGNDTFWVDNVGDALLDAGGVEQVYSSVSSTLPTGFENLALTGSAAINGRGNAAANTLDGTRNSAANVLTGLAGNDVYILGLGDSVIEAAGGGNDKVLAGFNYTLGDYQEILQLTGSGNIKGTGNALNNTLTGNAGSNYLWGNDGNDTLTGAGGKDFLFGGNGNDLFVYQHPDDSAPLDYDVIDGFTAGDKIDLSALDANAALAGDQAFIFITGQFHGLAGELHYFAGAIEGDVDGDGAADFYITVYPSEMAYLWSSADFIL